jgi:hypothetical protein
VRRIGVTPFQAAYMGTKWYMDGASQAIPQKGAKLKLLSHWRLRYWKTTELIILPLVLKLVIPSHRQHFYRSVQGHIADR